MIQVSGSKHFIHKFATTQFFNVNLQTNVVQSMEKSRRVSKYAVERARLYKSWFWLLMYLSSSRKKRLSAHNSIGIFQSIILFFHHFPNKFVDEICSGVDFITNIRTVTYMVHAMEFRANFIVNERGKMESHV